MTLHPATARGGTARRLMWACLLIPTGFLMGCGGAPAEDVPVAASGARTSDASAAPGGRGDASAPHAVALTYDDLPGVALPGAGCDPQRLRALNERMLAAFERNGVQATGLVTGSRMCAGAPDTALVAIYRRWLGEGHTLGNHTFSHRDLNSESLAWYTADIERNERLLDEARESGGDVRWFRAPFLRYGDTPAKHSGLRDYLAANGYEVARVSIDNQEWVFADVYGRAKARGDTAVMRRVAEAYVPFMDSVFAFFEARTTEMLGRYPPQVLLLHVNDLNVDVMDELVGMIRDRGYAIVPMEEALADPWYAEPDGYVGPRGLAWIHRRAVTEGQSDWPEEPREPEWLQALREQ